ncbi:DUF2339 domain-containing protein [Mucilaginibacter ginsenosidivorans]|uniref:DUF2339 domain-containing protein n=1 Tax=Mucilaginibacter ginsenosidivorans TaxID=398053 RepID=A0A5B8UWK9_9SPHI|nr:DUF2339 domain-containing protein [Mucilaginibacter ginsenosidivorans]QEC63520.1 DUF2339 domain-containing protein [Mucilaginibacter ginsenosidivorans]
MEVIYVFAFILIIVLLIINNSRLSEKIDNLEKIMVDLHHLINKLKKDLDIPAAPPAVIKTPEAPKPVLPPPPEPVPEVTRSYTPEPVTPPIIERHKEVINDPMALLRKPPVTIPPPRKPVEPQPSFFERHPDLEKFIGENLVNKIGIAILVLAIGFFVKYAIDQNWVGPAGRVAIGILCGGILVGIAHRLRKSYAAFSSVLVGGGIAVFYFTITLAFHQFHLFSQTVSFIILIVITAFAVALSLLYNRQELAIIALIGGMSGPFMVSTGQANYNALFTYYILLNAGLLVIAYFKSWRILNILAFGLTVLVLGGVIYTLPDKEAGTMFVYVSILYLVFFFTNIANNIKENKAFVGSDFTILLVNTALYFGAGLYLLTIMQYGQYRGLFCAAIGGLNLLLSFILFRSKKADINILYLLIGITLTFLSLTAPIQLHGHFITLFWAAESALLYWLYTKSDIRLMRLASTVIWVAMLMSLMMDWFELYSAPAFYDKPTIHILPIIANKGFITAVFSAVCSFLLYLLVNRSEKERRLLPPDVFRYGAFVLLFAAGLLEVNHQFVSRYPGTGLNILYLMLYVPAFIYFFLSVMGRIASFKTHMPVEIALLTLSIFVYLVCSRKYFDMQASVLISHKTDPSHLWAHWLSDVFVLLLFYKLISILRANFEASGKAATWFLTAALVTFLSLEVCLIVNSVFYQPGRYLEHIQLVYIKTGLPVLWGISSFALMWLGMRYKTRVLRIISLTLFSITLVKLFVYDIENIPAGGKIAAFFCLGVLLLIISFMYQKVKYIIKDDDANPEN